MGNLFATGSNPNTAGMMRPPSSRVIRPTVPSPTSTVTQRMQPKMQALAATTPTRRPKGKKTPDSILEEAYWESYLNPTPSQMWRR